MPIKALYVDDEPALLDIGKIFLEESGEISVDCASSVSEAEKSLLLNEYDAIISDYQMPGTNGIEFLKRLRSKNVLVPFILFTGRGREEVVIEALNSGADFYMQKGGNPVVQYAELEHYIRQGVQRYRSVVARKESEERFRSLVDNSFEGVGVHVERVLVEANNAFCAITGYSRDELIGKRMEELYTAQSWKIMQERLLLPVAEPYDLQIVRKDGSTITIKTRGKDISWNGRTARFSTILDLTERESMENRLMETERILQNLVESSPDIVWEVDEYGVFTYVSPRMKDILGFDESEVLGMSALELTSPGDMKEAQETVVRNTMEPKSFVTRFKASHKDGRPVEIELRGSPFKSPSGQLKGFRGVARHIAVDGRSPSPKGGDLLGGRPFDTSPLGIIIYDRKGSLVDINPAGIAMFGVAKKGHVIGSQLFDHVRDDILTSLRQGKIVRFTAPFRTMINRPVMASGIIKEGDLLYVTIIPHFDEAMSLVGYETHVQKAGDGLTEKEGKDLLLSSILNSLTDAKVFALDANYRYLVFNEGHAETMRQIWGREIEVGRSMLDIIGSEADRQHAKLNFDEVLSGKSLTAFEEYGDENLSRRMWRDHYSPVLSEDGKVLGLSCCCFDITDHMRTRKDLEDANHKLKMIYSITRHDLLNKLSALQGYLDLEMREPMAKERADRFVKMLHITNTLVSQINHSKEYQEIGILSPEWQSVSAICGLEAEHLDHEHVQVHIDTDGLEIYADPMLKRVFYNLMDNSLKHGEKVKNIWVSFERSDPGLRIVYRDDGVGINASVRERLFTEGIGAHGIGLFLIQDILRITGIMIAENGRAGEGVRFEMQVPSGQFRFR